jgi:hypothetical protein
MRRERSRGKKIAQFSARDSEAGAADKPAAADKPEATDKPAADKPAAAPKAAGSEKKEAAAPKKVWLDNGKVGFVVNLPWKADMKMTSYLDRMLDLCRKKGIEVYLVSTPLTMTALVNAGDCELAHDVVQKEADRYGVPYFDMNLIRDRQQKFPNIYMTDSEHLNMDGAKKCTGMLCSAIHYYRKEKK